ncbi:MAG: NADPH-dependent FMN reductase [Bacteroidota bacterium]
MIKKIVAIGASKSKTSINKLFAVYTAKQLQDAEVITLDLNDYELPLYSPDLEKEKGIPNNAMLFNAHLDEADGIVLSLAEYNGLHTAAFKNLWDWLSRIKTDVWKNKPMLLLAASPGGRGGANVLKITKDLMPYFGGKVITDFSLPSFHDNFKNGELTNSELNMELKEKIRQFQNALL